jgi:UTP--glucose-1-phosphate uridylyltransferase
MSRKVIKAIFPVAGLGTRFLPATKSIPKEIMTLVDKPLIQYAIDEARAAGIKEFIFVTSRGKGALEDYFDGAPLIEAALRKNNKMDLLKLLKSSTMDSGEIAYVRQREPLGLGHAVWCARRLIANEPFAVILPDDVIAAEKPCLQQMVEAYEEFGGNMVAAMEVPKERASSYGLLDFTPSVGQIVSIRRYILTPKVLTNLNKKEIGAGQEIQLTDAIAQEITNSNNVYGFRFQGRRYDCGSKAGYLKATVAFGLAHPELGEEFGAFLNGLGAARHAAQ